MWLISCLGVVRLLLPGDVFPNGALRRTAEMSELQMKYDRLVDQLSSIISDSGTQRLLARERGDDIISFRALLDTSKDAYSPLEGQIAFVQKGTEVLASVEDACNAREICLQSLLSRYQYASSHVPHSFSYEGHT